MTSENGVLYYWCVNCGNHGKFPFRRQVRHNCEKCNYDPITDFELEEILQDETLKLQFKEVLDENTAIAGP